jgi:hypothetical protein
MAQDPFQAEHIIGKLPEAEVEISNRRSTVTLRAVDVVGWADIGPPAAETLAHMCI